MSNDVIAMVSAVSWYASHINQAVPLVVLRMDDTKQKPIEPINVRSYSIRCFITNWQIRVFRFFP